MTTLVTILTEGFADWETALLNAVAHGFYKAEVHYASPGGAPVTSAGGMRVTPGMAIEDIDLDNLDALVVSGGTIWQTPAAPDLKPLLTATKQQGKVIGVICDATVAAARTGILDDVRHTSNGPGYLDATGYKGAKLYQDVPQAVADRKIVTASATAPVSFMAEVMRQVGLADDQLDYYVGMHATQFGESKKQAA
jgi:putative intracellular protease/amidase